MNSDKSLDELEITSGVEEGSKRVVTEDEIALVKAQEIFAPRVDYVQRVFPTLSRKEMIRVFSALMIYPFEAKALALLKPNTEEFAVFYYAVEAIEAKRKILNLADKAGISKQAETTAIDELVKEAKEQLTQGEEDGKENI